ncbi:MAG TPA: hypothetical protein VFF27_18580, partial [Bacteroidia bacterium]|nr:hypothetical protein [Bacteroidia bacterium]
PLKAKVVAIFIAFVTYTSNLSAQHYETQSIVYNTLIGGISACVGAIINKKNDEKWSEIFLKKFAIGATGGLVMYGGKKMNSLIATREKLGYAWLTRGVFYAGLSVVENTAAGKKFWETWHYDIGFVRFEFDCHSFKLQPKLMPAALGATVFLAYHGRLDVRTSLESGVPTFRARRIIYQTQLIGSTVTNGFLFSDSLKERSSVFYNTYAHEVIHSFQFSEFSGVNQFFKPLTDKWGTSSPLYKNIHKWVYGDLNHEMMLLNYFVVQGGVKRNYCRNFLENEAEFLSVRKCACAL